MKITKHKITKQLQDEIYLVASTLPPVGKMVNGQPVYRSVQVPGTEISKEDLKPGTPLVRTAMYRINRLVYEDHIQNMIRLVQKHGAEGIRDYENAIHAQVEAYKRADRHARSLTNKFFKQLHNLKSWLQRKKMAR